MIFWAFVMALAIATGLYLATRDHFRQVRAVDVRDDRSGWVYFVGGKDTPIKVGMSSKEPSQQRLPELKTMSPEPLTILFKFYTDDRFNAEKVLHEQLAEHRLHGEWFDRDVCLYYIDHLRGAC